MHLNIESVKIYKWIMHRNSNVLYAIVGYYETHIHKNRNICLAIFKS